MATNTLEKQTWTWQNHKIKYTVKGQGAPLLLIHGFGASIGHWRKNISVLADAGYQVYAVDLLGFGNSDKPALDYSLQIWVEMLKDFWTEKIQQPTIFIGNSIGALVSLFILAEHPEIAAGGVLINPAGGLSHRSQELNLLLSILINGFNRLVKHPLTGKFVFNLIRRKSQIRRTLYQVYSDRQAVTEELVDLLYQPSCDPGAQAVFASILTAPPGPTPQELLSKVQCQLLLIWGANDPWTPITGAQIYEQQRENGKKIKILPIPGAGHCPHDEVPDIVNPQIIGWLVQEKLGNNH